MTVPRPLPSAGRGVEDGQRELVSLRDAVHPEDLPRTSFTDAGTRTVRTACRVPASKRVVCCPSEESGTTSSFLPRATGNADDVV
jgi:hypothetical protein